MRLIDCDAFKADYRMADECKDCKTPVRACEYDRVYTKMDFCSWLDDAPTIEPEREKGRWNCSDDMYESAVCSVCGWDTTEPWGHIRHWFSYCPNCGADMREGGAG